MAWYAVLGTVCTGAAVGPLVLGMGGIVAAGAAALGNGHHLMVKEKKSSSVWNHIFTLRKQD